MTVLLEEDWDDFGSFPEYYHLQPDGKRIPLEVSHERVLDEEWEADADRGGER